MTPSNILPGTRKIAMRYMRMWQGILYIIRECGKEKVVEDNIARGSGRSGLLDRSRRVRRLWHIFQNG